MNLHRPPLQSALLCLPLLLGLAGCVAPVTPIHQETIMPSTPTATPAAELFQSRILTPPGSFTGGAEGPVVGPDGAL